MERKDIVLNNGVTMPPIGYGVFRMTNLEECESAVVQAVKTGYRLIDTAAAYENETAVGKAIKRVIAEGIVKREDLFVTTKLWITDTNYEKAKEGFQRSLDRLGLDYVDIFYHHRMDPETPLEETMGALDSIVKSGKALYVGLSNYDGPTLERACAILNDLKCPFIINQNRYSIFDRTIEKNGLKDTARRLQRGIIAFSPLAQGMLTDRYLNGIPADSRIATDGRFLKETALTPERLSQIRALNELAKKRGQTLAEMALSWILKDGDVTSVLIGASRPEQILDNIAIVGHTSFTPEELDAIDQITL